jgi:hypothetical protein
MMIVPISCRMYMQIRCNIPEVEAEGCIDYVGAEVLMSAHDHAAVCHRWR